MSDFSPGDGRPDAPLQQCGFLRAALDRATREQD
jgi:hypothetical protein